MRVENLEMLAEVFDVNHAHFLFFESYFDTGLTLALFPQLHQFAMSWHIFQKGSSNSGIEYFVGVDHQLAMRLL